MIYVGIALLLCLLFWRWRQKLTVVLSIAIACFVLLFLWTVLEEKLEERKLAEVPCAVVNAKIGAKKLVTNEQGVLGFLLDDGFVAVEKRAVTKQEMLEHAVRAGLLGEHSANNLKRIDEALPFLKDENVEYSRQGVLLSNSLFQSVAEQCADADIYVLLYNASEETLGNEKMRISARKKNHSTNIIDIADRDLWEDRVLRPREQIILCRKLTNFRRQKTDLSDVIFEVQLSGVKVHKE